MRLVRFSCRGSDVGHLAPGAEGGIASGTVLVGGQAVAAELKMVVDAALGGLVASTRPVVSGAGPVWEALP